MPAIVIAQIIELDSRPPEKSPYLIGQDENSPCHCAPGLCGEADTPLEQNPASHTHGVFSLQGLGGWSYGAITFSSFAKVLTRPWPQALEILEIFFFR